MYSIPMHRCDTAYVCMDSRYVTFVAACIESPELDMGPFLLTQSNPPTHGSNPIQSIKLPENPDPIQSNQKIASITANS